MTVKTRCAGQDTSLKHHIIFNFQTRAVRSFFVILLYDKPLYEVKINIVWSPQYYPFDKHGRITHRNIETACETKAARITRDKRQLDTACRVNSHRISQIKFIKIRSNPRKRRDKTHLQYGDIIIIDIHLAHYILIKCLDALLIEHIVKSR